ncbi:uncharacterized protein [Macrobrachium rosenbergii]|uniref:uncharacterized protein n=1 Tax=Macrobrachium rosenbergii TaxID=79674 RepID=UPI0034D7A782
MCNSGFNDDSRCPRSLPCSHNLCTECIDYLITKNNRHCPFCGHEFKSTSSADFMINRALLECISSLPALRRQYSRQASKKSTAYQQRIADFKKDVCTANEVISSDLGELEKDVERIMRVEEDFQEGYNRQKSEFCHRVLDQIKEFQANMDGHFEASRTSSLRLQKLRQELKKREEKLASAKRTLDSASSLEEMASLMDKTEEVNTAVNGWAESAREDLLEKETQIQERKKALKASQKMQNSLTKALTSKPKEDVLHPVPITGASASKMDLSSQVTALGLWEMRFPEVSLVNRVEFTLLQMMATKEDRPKSQSKKQSTSSIAYKKKKSPSPRRIMSSMRTFEAWPPPKAPSSWT